MDTIEVSKCCRADVLEPYDEINVNTCAECGKPCEAEKVCAECRGTGKIRFDEPVYPGEPHMADTGTRKCPSCGPMTEEDY